MNTIFNESCLDTMKRPECIATIKFSKQELELAINALQNLIKIQIPYSDNNDWKRPYKSLEKNLTYIRQQMIDKVEDSIINRQISSSIVEGDVCQD